MPQMSCSVCLHVGHLSQSSWNGNNSEPTSMRGATVAVAACVAHVLAMTKVWVASKGWRAIIELNHPLFISFLLPPASMLTPVSIHPDD